MRTCRKSVKIIRDNTAAEFLARTKNWLEKAEVENNLILGIAGYFEVYSGKLELQPHFLTVHDNGTIVGAALMTPPRQLLMSRMPDLAVIALADYLLAHGAPLPGVVGFTTNANRFADYWTSKTGRSSLPKRSDRLYACEKVVDFPYSAGRLRPASKADEPLLSDWCVRFCVDAGIEDETVYFQAQLPQKIADQSLFVWEDSEILSMAGIQRQTPHGVAISWVYTPAHLRRHGYATSCVAALTQRMLDCGKSFCCLYADLANLSSNSIYQKIGFQPICDVQHWVFE